MTARDDARAPELGPVKHCGAYTPGHEVHFIQARRSAESGGGDPTMVTRVDDDGTVTFADGTTKWNHDPARLRAALDRYGTAVRRGGFGVLRVPHPGGAYCFCLGAEPTPCPGPAQAPTSLEDLVTRATERGGFLVSGPDVLRLARERRRR